MAGGLGLFGIIEQLVLLANAMAIINEERILKKCEFKRQLAHPQFDRAKREPFNRFEKAAYFWALHHEELREIFPNNSKHTDHLPQANFWLIVKLIIIAC